MKCGIVILNYNTYKLTCELVKNALKIELIEKIVIVDNNSNDNFSDFCKAMDNDKIQYIKNNENLGYAAGNNIGLKYLKNKGFDYGFIANPDVIFDYKTIENILSFLNKNNDYGVVSAVRTQNGSKNTAQYWWIPNFSNALWESVFIGRKIQGNRSKKISNNVIETSKREFFDVEVVGGAFFGCNLDIMEAIGYLDEHTFLWYEENILSFKLRENKYKVALLKTCSYDHNHKKNGHGNKKHKVFVKSKRYYCYEYLKINDFQKILLSLFDFIGIVENKLICIISRKERSKKE